MSPGEDRCFFLRCYRNPEKLAADKVVRPGVTVLERMIVAARRGAERETTKRLAAVLDEPGRALLDRLLVPDGSTDRTLLTWIRQGEVATTPTAILSALERRATLIGWGVDRWDLQALHPNRLKFLARLGKRSTNQALQRAPAERRYPILVAFLRQALEETTDEVIDLFDRCLARASARADRKLEEFRLAVARTTDEAVQLDRKQQGRGNENDEGEDRRSQGRQERSRGFRLKSGFPLELAVDQDQEADGDQCCHHSQCR